MKVEIIKHFPTIMRLTGYQVRVIALLHITPAVVTRTQFTPGQYQWSLPRTEVCTEFSDEVWKYETDQLCNVFWYASRSKSTLNISSLTTCLRGPTRMLGAYEHTNM